MDVALSCVYMVAVARGVQIELAFSDCIGKRGKQGNGTNNGEKTAGGNFVRRCFDLKSFDSCIFDIRAIYTSQALLSAFANAH